MIRALVLNDIHVAASPPIGARDLYVQDVFNMLREARDYARNNGCHYTILTGDLFHAKRNVPYWLVRDLIELFAEWPGRKLAIVGNHDLGYGGLASVPHQPIGVLFEAGVLEWLREDIVTEDCIPNAPGQPHGDCEHVRIQWSPANYTDTLDHNPQNFGLERRDGVDWAVKVSHGSLTPPGKPFPYHTIPVNTVPTEGMDLVLNGHLHNDSGLQDVKGCTFACLGSLGRTQRTEDNLTRPMRLLQVQFSKTDMFFDELLLVSAAPAADLFYAKDSGEEVEISAALKRFVGGIEAAVRLEEGDSLEEVIAKLGNGETVDARAKCRLVEYLSKAGFD